MKGNKMSAILAILIMLSGVLTGIARAGSTPVVPGSQAAAVVANVLSNGANDVFTGNGPFVAYPYKTLEDVTGQPPSYLWFVYIDVINVTRLFTYQIGFTFDAAVLQIVNFTGPSQYWEINGHKNTNPTANWFLSAASAVAGNATHELVKMNGLGEGNVGGKITAEGYYCTDPTTAENGSGLLMEVCFEVNPSFVSSHTGTAPGTPVPMANFSITETDIQTILVYYDGKTKITPPQNDCYNGTVLKTEVITPVRPPTVTSVITPSPTVTVGTTQTFTATAGQGWNGTNYVPIMNYVWVNNTNSEVIASGIGATFITATFPLPGTYSVTLTVWAWMWDNATTLYNMSASDIQTATVYPKATGCQISLYTQSWRYIDPYYIFTNFTGDKNPTILSENNSQADTFRPGDLVQLFANATYNGAPVANAFITFQVWDNKGTTVLIATATTDCYGVAEWDFRIPWPSTESLIINNFTETSYAPNETTWYFGMWKAIATWQLGSQFTELPPFEKTQTAGIIFDVSWGLSIDAVYVSPTTVARGPASCGVGSVPVTVKVNIVNEYLEAISASDTSPAYNPLITVTLYDNLLVPIYPPAWLQTPILPSGFPGLPSINYTMPLIYIPSYAFVGTAYAVANILSTFPQNGGTAFCPTAWTTFQIKAP